MGKTLLAHCREKYSEGERALWNGVQDTEEGVLSMVEVICETFKEGSVILPAISGMQLSDDESFSFNNPGDLVGLVFDAVTSQNRNPELWFEEGIRGEISSTISTMVYGPHSLAPDPNRGVKADNYPEAFDQLKSLLDKRYSLFR